MSKGEVRSWSNLISEERVKFSEQNSENLMKFGWKIRKLWNFDSFANFQETFLDQSVWICKWVSWWCHRLTIFHSFCTQKWQKISYFSYEYVRLALMYSLNRCRILLTPIYLDMRDITIKSLGKILKFSKLYVQNIWQVVRRWHHQLTHLHIHTDWSRNVSWKFVKLQNVITSLFFSRFSSGFHCFVQKILLFLLKLS